METAMQTVRHYFRVFSRSFMHFFRRLPHMKFNHLFLFPVVFLWDEFLLRLLTGTSLFSHFLYPIIFAISAGFFWSGVTTLFKRKINRRISIALLAITALFFTIECILKNTYQVYFDIFGIINGTGGVVGNYGGDVINAIIGGIWVIILYFLPLLLYLWRGRRQMPASRYHPLFAVILVVGSMLFGGIGILFAGNLPSTRDQYNGQFTYDEATQSFGLITSTRLDLKYGIFGNKSAEKLTKQSQSSQSDEETADEKKDYGYNVMDIDFDELAEETSEETYKEIDEYVASLEPTNKNKYTGLFEGKNLITICAEAFSSQVISEELTPTLYRLANNGIKFTDFYQPAWGGSTSTGEYSVLLGLVPTGGETSMMDTIGDNLYFTTGNQFQRLGYTSVVFHNGDYDYYNRDQTHLNLGYDDFLAWGNGLEEFLPEWSDDPETVEATMPLYVDKQPFNVYYMSYSGHCTYKESSSKTKKNLDRVKEVLGDSYKDTTMYYFCYQLELEYALEYMVDELEDLGIADDTVIVLCTDHYPYGLAKSSTFGNSQDYLLDLYGVDEYDSFLRDKTTCIIWSESIEGMGLEIDEPTMSLDILPTLSNLFGLEYDSRLLVGRDVFSDAMPLALWNNTNFVTDKGYYEVGADKFYPNEGVEVDDDYVEEVKTIVKNKISYSTQVVKYDYFGYLFGDDDVSGTFDRTDVAELDKTTDETEDEEESEEDESDEDESAED